MTRWPTYANQLLDSATRSMSHREYTAIHSYPWEPALSIAGLWSWRGSIFKKYMGFMPTPEEIGMDPTDSFFDPDYVCESCMYNSSQEPIEYHFYHHGRKLRRSEKKWKNYVLPRIAELRKQGDWVEGVKVNGRLLDD